MSDIHNLFFITDINLRCYRSYTDPHLFYNNCCLCGFIDMYIRCNDNVPTSFPVSDKVCHRGTTYLLVAAMIYNVNDDSVSKIFHTNLTSFVSVVKGTPFNNPQNMSWLSIAMRSCQQLYSQRSLENLQDFIRSI